MSAKNANVSGRNSDKADLAAPWKCSERNTEIEGNKVLISYSSLAIAHIYWDSRYHSTGHSSEGVNSDLAAADVSGEIMKKAGGEPGDLERGPCDKTMLIAPLRPDILRHRVLHHGPQ